MEKNEVIENLMDGHGTQILHLAYSYVRNRETAEDLTQEIFLKCYEKLDTFKGKSKLQTWLFRVAVNHCKDYLRSWYHRRVVLTDYFSGVIFKTDNSPEQQFFHNSDQQDIQRAIFQLPVKYREMIFLYYYHDLTQKEISEICDLNINTVKSRLARAKELLKNNLGEGEVDYGKPIKAVKKPDVKG